MMAAASLFRRAGPALARAAQTARPGRMMVHPLRQRHTAAAAAAPPRAARLSLRCLSAQAGAGADFMAMPELLKLREADKRALEDEGEAALDALVTSVQTASKALQQAAVRAQGAVEERCDWRTHTCVVMRARVYMASAVRVRARRRRKETNRP